MAEAVFQHQVNQAGLAQHFLIDSAGTTSWHEGETAHPGTLAVLRRHHIPYNGRSRPLTKADLSAFDYLLGMDRSHIRVMQQMADSTAGEIALFLSYAHKAGTVDIIEVPDPWYDGEYDRTYDLVTRGCDALLAHIRTKHNL
jgi:protein-tyrosine phosphatase